MRISVVALVALSLMACGGEAKSSDAAPADQAQQAAVDPAEAPAAAPAPPPRSGGERVAAAAPAPTAADSAAAAREDVSPEWKMNQRNMAPYRECMAQASTTPDNVRPRLEEACRRLPDAPK